MAFLQVYTDDSVAETGDRRLFFAGYLNSSANWQLFSEAWAEELAYRPSIRYLHMVEAKAMRGQFAGWSADNRDEKLRGLARVIRHFRPISFEFSISTKDYSEVVKSFAPRGLSPQFICTYGTVAMIARYLVSQKAKVKADFIFDESDGVSADIALLFERMAKDLPKAARAMISGSPIFRNDKDFLPLQAADMLAWHLRRNHEVGDHSEMASRLRNDECHIVQSADMLLPVWGAGFSEITQGVDLQSKLAWRSARRGLAEQLAGDRQEARKSFFRRMLSVFRG